MKFTKTVFVRSDNQYNQFSKLKIGQWVTGLTLNFNTQKSGFYRGQFMGFDNDNQPIINFRIDNARNKLDWKNQFKSNKSLRDFARIKC
jgi:hypothetical protein